MSLLSKIKHKGYQKIHSFKNDLSWQLGINTIEKTSLKGTRILVYHGIDQHDNRSYNTRFISQKRFAEHLKYFKQYFEIVSLQDLLEGKIKENQFNLAITFDDGYRNNLTYALPILEQYQVPATFCITGIMETDLPILWTDYLDIAARESKKSLPIEGITYVSKRRYPWSNFEYQNDEGTSLKTIAKNTNQTFKKALLEQLQKNINLDALVPFSDYWQQLQKEEIQQLAQHPLIDIASHGYYHNNLGAIPFLAACEELLKSKQFLERQTQQPIKTMVYPDGSYTKELVAYGKSIGYQYHLITGFQDEKDKADAAIIDRMTINPFISTYNQILAIIQGNYYGGI